MYLRHNLSQSSKGNCDLLMAMHRRLLSRQPDFCRHACNKSLGIWGEKPARDFTISRHSLDRLGEKQLACTGKRVTLPQSQVGHHSQTCIMIHRAAVTVVLELKWTFLSTHSIKAFEQNDKMDSSNAHLSPCSIGASTIRKFSSCW